MRPVWAAARIASIAGPEIFVRDDDLDLHLGQKVDDVLRPP